MTHGTRAGALVGLLVASLVAGGLVGVAGASPADASAVGAQAGLAAATSDDLSTLQSADNESSSLANTSIAHDGDRVTLTPAVGETISGETDLDPGTTVYVRVKSEDPQSPFLVSGETEVTDDGSFTAQLDLSDVQANTAVNVTVRNDSRVLAHEDGEVVRCTENCSGPDEWPEFERSIVEGTAGSAVDITIDVPEEHDGPVNVTLGDENSNFVVEATVEDANDDGEIVLTLDTERAGDGSPNEYLSAGEDGIVAVQQHSEDITPPLESGHYELEIGPTGAPYDVGTLALTDPEREDDDEGEATPDRGDVPEIDVNTTGEVTFITAGDTLELGNADGQTIRAETELEPGSKVLLRLESEEASNPFLMNPEATVTEYGTINATVDLDRVSAGTTFSLVARHDGEAVGATAGRIVECDSNCSQVASVSQQSGSAQQSVSAENGSEDSQEESNVVEVDDEQAGSLPITGLAAIGVGGLLAVAGLVRFTGFLGR